MKRQIALWVVVSILCGLGVVTAFIPAGEVAASVTTTSTIVGNLVPTFTTLANAWPIEFFPLGGLVLFTIVGKFFGLKGDTGVFLALTGLTAGGVFGDLPSSTATAPLVPFALIFVLGLQTMLWWWIT